MHNINTVKLVGTVGAVPALYSTDDGQAVAIVLLQTQCGVRDPGGRLFRDTAWHRVAIEGTAARIVKKTVKEGDTLMVEGRLAYRSGPGPDGRVHQMVEIVVAGPNSYWSDLGPGDPVLEDLPPAIGAWRGRRPASEPAIKGMVAGGKGNG